MGEQSRKMVRNAVIRQFLVRGWEAKEIVSEIRVNWKTHGIPERQAARLTAWAVYKIAAMDRAT